MPEKKETMTIKVETHVLAILDMIAAKRRKATGKSLTISDTILWMAERADPESVTLINAIPEEDEDESDE